MRNLRDLAAASRSKYVETKMKKIVAGSLMSLDGVIELPENCHFPYLNEEMGSP
jgi:hypothetical protein